MGRSMYKLLDNLDRYSASYNDIWLVPEEQLALPIDAYCSEEIFREEQEKIFSRASLYVGHEAMVPEVGDWHALSHEENARVLLRGEQGIELISNVCRHRQAIMLGGAPIASDADPVRRGKLGGTGNRIFCPIHAWSYDQTGKLVNAPKFAKQPCANLQRFQLSNVSGLLFEGMRNPAADMASLFAMPEFDFSDYALGHVELHACAYNWKTFLEIYNDDYHIAPFHPGLSRYVNSKGLHWDYGDWFSVQRIGVTSDLNRAGTEAYKTWHTDLLTYNEGLTPEFGAIWATYYPTHMIEVFPHALVLSTLYPKSVNSTLNVVEFYYPAQLLKDCPALAESHRKAYMETALEDDEIAERIDAGRRALYRRGVTEAGPYQTPMEDGIRHFHGWYRAVMK
ncbi:MAG TPA: aromatic ring-hydroxylating dioxygenase subunit alpha [Cellvibrio sp.]|nr:aromatic ring-hydroxylating dioxygenase subunit alpha [Cellvibrio sp.]